MPTFTPEIAQAYKNDPRTKMAVQLMASGANTGPVAGGGWAWADGIARALSGAAGGYIQHKQDQKYEKREQDMVNAVAASLAGNGGGVEAAAQQGVGVQPPPQGVPAQQPAPAMVPPAPQNNPEPPAVDPLAPLPDAAAAPQGAPQGAQPPQGIPTPPPPPPGFQNSPEAAQIAQALGGAQPGPQGVVNVPFAGPNGAMALNAMIPITLASESGNRNFRPDGKPVTSPVGAKYAMQVMPATAAKPGFGIKPAANDSPEEYNRVGEQLLGKMMQRYGNDPAKAWAAYNAGPGRVDKALKRHGDNWLANMPKETRDYVAKNTSDPRMAGADGGAQTGGSEYYPEAREELKPTGPIQYQTAEPAQTMLPQRPEDRGAAQSYRMQNGKNLLALRDPALFERAMKMMDDGMGEQFAADRDALANNNTLDRDLYTAGINDHYTAQNQGRAAAYDARSDERREGFAYGREMRGYAHANNDREDNQDFTASQDGIKRTWQSGENALDRQATANNLATQIEGKKETEAEKRNNRIAGWIQTPQGSKMYTTVTETITKNDGLVNDVDAFMALNEKQSTGGFLMNSPPEWFARNMNTNIQQMNQITEKIAPTLRTAGSGAMSDKDLAGFKTSVPNIKVGLQANRGAAERLKLGVARVNDFEMEKLAAQAEGRGVDFLREWTVFKNKVSYTTGKTFQQWKSENSYGADGGRK